MTKDNIAKTPEHFLCKVTGNSDTSSGNIRLLTSGLALSCNTDNYLLNKIEFNAIRSLIAFVAHEQKVMEGIVEEIMVAHFDIESVKRLPSRLYQNAIEYLVDLKIRNIIN